MGKPQKVTGLEFLLHQQEAIALFLEWAQHRSERGEDTDHVPAAVAQLDEDFTSFVASLAQDQVGKTVAKQISSLEEELAATKQALREMFKKYKESEREAAFKKVDLDNIHRSMLISELGRSKTEAATAQRLAEERVSEMWEKVSAAEDQVADLEEELLTLRVKQAELLRENEEYRLGEAEAERRSLARRIALYPVAADPHVAAAIKSRLIVRLDEVDARGDMFSPELEKDRTAFDQEGKFTGRLTQDEAVTNNPFVDDYDDNEDSVVRYFTDPLLDGVAAPPTHSAADDRLLPDRGELQAQVVVEMEIETPDGRVEKRVVSAPPMEERPPALPKDEAEWTDQLVHELGLKNLPPKVSSRQPKPVQPPKPPSGKPRRI